MGQKELGSFHDVRWQLFDEGAHDRIWRVIRFGHVAEEDFLQATARQLANHLAGIVIGEMASPPLNTLLEFPRVGAFTQHGWAVIRFEDHRRTAAESVEGQAREVADVGDYSQLLRSMGDDEGDGPCCIMKGREGGQGQVANSDGATGMDVSTVRKFLQRLSCCSKGFGSGIDWQTEFSSQDADSLDVIAMLVGDDDCRQFITSDADLGEPFEHSFATQTGIDEHSCRR